MLTNQNMNGRIFPAASESVFINATACYIGQSTEFASCLKIHQYPCFRHHDVNKPKSLSSLNMENVVELLKGARQTNVTKTTRSKLYPTVSPTRPELSQKGKVVLVTGGGSNIGLSLSHAFVQASSDTIIIVGRRTAVLEGARKELEDEAHAAGTGTKIIARSADLTNLVDIAALWKELGNKGLTVDVYVANAATITGPAPLFEVGADGVWAGIEGNLKSQLYMTEKFMAQGGDKKKVVASDFVLGSVTDD